MTYEIQMDRRRFSGWADGRPFTLADCWRETYGVGGCTIWQGDRRVLANAGSLTQRTHIRRILTARWFADRARQAMWCDDIGHERIVRPLP